MNASDWATLYAAIVATGALFLEVRRWFESGPKLIVTAKPGMTLINQRGPDRDGLLIVNVINRGEAPTTLTLLAMLEYPNAWARWRRRPSKSFFVPHPTITGMTNMPHVLRPGEMWSGAADGTGEATGDVQSGNLWVAIYTTDRDRPYLARIPKRSTPLELKDAKQV